MEFKSSYDYIAPELAYTPRELNQTALALDQLTAASLPKAREVLKKAMVKQTGNASAQQISDEAKALLRELLSERDEIPMLADDAESEREWRESLEGALKAEATQSLEQVDREWLEMRARDLSRAMATFWWNLDPDDSERRSSSCSQIMQRENADKLKLGALGERFGLTIDDANDLLRAVGCAHDQQPPSASGTAATAIGAAKAATNKYQQPPSASGTAATQEQIRATVASRVDTWR